jgi:two-component system nitrate/nitrite response regulator NarL
LIQIVIADDHPLVLDGLTQLFASEEDVEVVRRCTNGEEALAAAREAHPDVLVLDVRMPALGGLEVLRALSAEKNPARVVLLTAQMNDIEILSSVRCGVAGIVLKETAPRVLLQCVRAVAAGERWLDSRMIQSAVETTVRRDAAQEKAAKELTRRELDIARMVATGARNREIGEKLGISEGTVKMHLHTIYEKLGIGGRVELSNYAREHALV